MSAARFLPPTPARSRIMSAIRGRWNVTTELRLAGALRRAGITGWRRHLKLPGRPDFAFPQQKVAVFVDGCFWHGCPRCYKPPKRNAVFWAEKISANRERDRRVALALRRKGWAVVRLREHELVDVESAIRKIRIFIARNKPNRTSPPS